MICPVCKTTKLVGQELDPGLPSAACPKCGGQWVESTRYWKWLDAQGGKTPERAPEPGAVELQVTESSKAKLCPECGRFLTRAKVGHGVAFILDRCGNCGGVWLDANEWQALKARNLHDNLHEIFSGAWQAAVAKEAREKAHDQLLREKLGDADFNEVKRVKAWLDGHPKRAELYAVLLDGYEPPREVVGAGDRSNS